jgi:hypothetical protein
MLGRVGTLVLGLGVQWVLVGCGSTVVYQIPRGVPETRPEQPAPGQVWIEGHYEFSQGSGTYAWVSGRWETGREGYRFHPGRYRWVVDGGTKYKVWAGGEWVAVAASPPPEPPPEAPPRPTKPQPRQLPAPVVEVQPVAPAGGYVWVAGHYEWRGETYVWVAGHWEAPRQSAVWVPGHYSWQVFGLFKVKVWVPGRWDQVEPVGPSVVELPPAPQEMPGPQTHPTAVWNPGHYTWDAARGQYRWIAGRWQYKAGHRWMEGRYEWQVLGDQRVNVWVTGHWEYTGPRVVELPRDPAEPRGNPTAPGAVWVAGHYDWDEARGQYRWIPGHWSFKQDHRWVEGRYEWQERGDFRIQVWAAGRWEHVVPAGPRVVELPVHPQEARGNPASPGSEWIPGHYEFDESRGQYRWVAGHYEYKPGQRWVDGRYEWRVVGGFKVQVWVVGQWLKTEPVVVELPRVPGENRGNPTREGAVWVAGHFDFESGRGEYRWIPGHWSFKEGHRWVEGHYESAVIGNWRIQRWAPGHWEAAAAPPQPVRQSGPVVVELPAAQAERQPPPPAHEAVWVPGHYRWDGAAGRYQWVPGHYSKKAGARWVPGHYEWRVVGNFKVQTWVPGRWDR